MVPFESGKWLLMICSGGSGIIGKYQNTQFNWILLKPAIRISSMTSRDLKEVLSTKPINLLGKIKVKSVWVETAGCEVYLLENCPWE